MAYNLLYFLTVSSELPKGGHRSDRNPLQQCNNLKINKKCCANCAFIVVVFIVYHNRNVLSYKISLRH
jgi:hypothetical protein